MTFGSAIEALKSGARVAREGWDGKGMWLALMPGMVIPEGMVNGRTKKFVPTGDLPCQPYIALWTAAGQWQPGQWQPGWLASQADMLADDWRVVE